MNKLNKKGFTLIEVVLVLAIGGLIFLLAFIAFQQVSVNRRDTQRRSDAGRVLAETQNYKSDKGTVPPDLGTLIASNLGGSSFTDPNGNVYVDYSTVGGTFKTPQIKYTLGDGVKAGCKTGTVLSPADVKVEVALEKGVACRDSL